MGRSKNGNSDRKLSQHAKRKSMSIKIKEVPPKRVPPKETSPKPIEKIKLPEMSNNSRKWARYTPKNNIPIKPKEIIQNVIIEEVIFDVAICIPSHNRYEKIYRLLTQFYTQETKFTFQIILLNDGSEDSRYNDLTNQFPKLVYLKNPIPNGKEYHWVCYSQLWGMIKHFKYTYLLQLDDDFILCDNFLNKIINILEEQHKINNNIIGIAPHSWSFHKDNSKINEEWWQNNTLIDGIGLFYIQILKDLNYTLNPVKNVTHIGVSVKVWSQFHDYLVKENKIIYRTPTSLAYHDGNLDPQLHKNFRNIKQIHTQNLDKSLLKYIKL